MRILGVDPGDRRIGLALSDDEGVIALPHRTLAADPSAAVNAKNIAEIATEQGCEMIVIGLPLRLDGSEGNAARKTHVLAKKLRACTEVPLVLWDERLTTAQAQRALRSGNMGAKKERSVIDQAAATLLLQSYLDSKAEPRWTDPEMQMPTPDPEARRASRVSRSEAARRNKRDD